MSHNRRSVLRQVNRIHEGALQIVYMSNNLPYEEVHSSNFMLSNIPHTTKYARNTFTHFTPKIWESILNDVKPKPKDSSELPLQRMYDVCPKCPKCMSTWSCMVSFVIKSIATYVGRMSQMYVHLVMYAFICN